MATINTRAENVRVFDIVKFEGVWRTVMTIESSSEQDLRLYLKYGTDPWVVHPNQMIQCVAPKMPKVTWTNCDDTKHESCDTESMVCGNTSDAPAQPGELLHQQIQVVQVRSGDVMKFSGRTYTALAVQLPPVPHGLVTIWTDYGAIFHVPAKLYMDIERPHE